MNEHRAQSGDLLSRLVRDCTAAKKTGIPHEILVGLEAYKFLERCTGGKQSFMGFPYIQEENADKLMVRLKKVQKG